ncbi:hypothetical protein U0070_000372 [Myodes glareolus]|uniref:Uncharacterized protein n=1 Tax=Myodes glareolus TaxID=447135 RepID=A0AAW0H8Q9_MYOGA
MVNTDDVTDDVNAIILVQSMLDRFEKTSETLLNFNNPSSVQLQRRMKRKTPSHPVSSQQYHHTSEQRTGFCDTSPGPVSPSLSPGFEDLSFIQPDSLAINGHSQTDDGEGAHG